MLLFHYLRTTGLSFHTINQAVETSANHCGCLACTYDIWDTYAGKYKCGARIEYLRDYKKDTYPTEADACARVAGVEFPDICGPYCDPATCHAAPTLPPALSPTSTPSTFPPSPLPTPGPTKLNCGCHACTAEVLDTYAGAHKCGARINYLVTYMSNTYPTEEAACARVAGVEFPGDCGPHCDPAKCDRTPAPTSAPTTPAPTTSKPTPEPSTTAPSPAPTSSSTTFPPTQGPTSPPSAAKAAAPPLSYTSSSPSSSPFGSSSRCGCDAACTDDIWDTYAGQYTCGARIAYLRDYESDIYPTEEHACARVAGKEFPAVCGPGCDPARCNNVVTPGKTSATHHHDVTYKIGLFTRFKVGAHDHDHFVSYFFNIPPSS
jgi:hypothetical protein